MSILGITPLTFHLFSGHRQPSAPSFAFPSKHNAARCHARTKMADRPLSDRLTLTLTVWPPDHLPVGFFLQTPTVDDQLLHDTSTLEGSSPRPRDSIALQIRGKSPVPRAQHVSSHAALFLLPWLLAPHSSHAASSPDLFEVL